MSLPLTGKVALVTGANTGIGRVTAEELARRGAKVWLACRSLAKTQPVLDAVRAAGGQAEFLPMELSSLASVREAAAIFLASGDPLHLLINNAGVAGVRTTTQDGFETTFGVNHLAHFLLTELLLDRLKQSAPARVVIVASRAHLRTESIHFEELRGPTPSAFGLRAYGESKLANVLHARELARRLQNTGVTTYALHPGVIASDIWRRIPWPLRNIAMWFMKTTEEGAATTLYCATAPELASESGGYYADQRRTPPGPKGEDDALAAELYRRSVAWTAG